MLGRNNKSDHTTGIDIGTHTARAIISRKNSPDDSYAEIIAVAACDSKGLRNGYITNLNSAKETLQTLLSQLKDQSGIDVRRANISMGGIGVSSIVSSGEAVVTRADGIIAQNDIDRAIAEAVKKIDLTNREILHTIPIVYKIDSKECHGRPLGMRGSKIEARVFFVICLSQHLSDLIDLFTEVGIQVDNVIASPIAAASVALTDNQRHNGAMLANIGAETVSIVVFEKDLPLSLQVFPIGGADFTKDIALGLKLAIEEAEQVKLGRSQGAHSERKLNEIIEARLRDIFEIIEKHLKRIGRDALLPAGIVITGGGAHISQIESLARSTLRLPCRVGIPEHLLEMKPRIRDVSWTVAYGLSSYRNDATASKVRDSGSKGQMSKKIRNFFHDLMP